MFPAHSAKEIHSTCNFKRRKQEILINFRGIIRSSCLNRLWVCVFRVTSGYFNCLQGEVWMGKKTIGTFLFLGFLLFVMTITMPVTRLGSGFLVGEGQHVLTYHDLVKEAGVLKVKFPNEDDIAAEVVFTDPASNLAILKLKEMPKVKRLPLSISTKSLSLQGEQVFTLGYPWTNTLEDQHVLIEGSARPASMLIELKMPLNLVHSGSPLFNVRQEVVGLVLLEEMPKSRSR